MKRLIKLTLKYVDGREGQTRETWYAAKSVQAVWQEDGETCVAFNDHSNLNPKVVVTESLGEVLRNLGVL